MDVSDAKKLIDNYIDKLLYLNDSDKIDVYASKYIKFVLGDYFIKQAGLKQETTEL